MVELVGSIVGFVLGVLVSGLAIYVGGRVAADVDDYGRAVVTALLGIVAGALLGVIPFIGGLLALVAWIAIINWQYPGDWIEAIVIGLVAWITSILLGIVLGVVLGMGSLVLPGF